eukprot:5005133-Prymnesium_polylepis.1
MTTFAPRVRMKKMIITMASKVHPRPRPRPSPSTMPLSSPPSYGSFGGLGGDEADGLGGHIGGSEGNGCDGNGGGTEG